MATERERCIAAMCPHCAAGDPVEFQADPQPMYWHGSRECKAAPIHLLSEIKSTPKHVEVLQMVWDDLRNCAYESDDDEWHSKELEPETERAVRNLMERRQPEDHG
jgi:hypothetical protein